MCLVNCLVRFDTHVIKSGLATGNCKGLTVQRLQRIILQNREALQKFNQTNFWGELGGAQKSVHNDIGSIITRRKVLVLQLQTVRLASRLEL